MREFLSLIVGIIVGSSVLAFSSVPAPNEVFPLGPEMQQDTIPVKPKFGDFITDPNDNPFDITPSIVEQKVEYDPESGNYIVFEKIGDEYFRTPTYLTFEEYLDWRSKQEEKDYFQRLAGVNTGKRNVVSVGDPMEKIDIQRNLVDRLFGGTEVDIQPQGNVDLTFGLSYYRTENPNLPLRQQRQGPLLDFDMDIDMSVDGGIGEKLNLGFNYDTQASFDFDRKIKLEYDTEQFSEDDIIKKIEAGNVSLPLRSNLIQGAQNLFGLKTELQFGHLKVTALASQQRSERNNIRIENGASIQSFEMTPDQYDENRHFFLSHFNRESYEGNLDNLPYINTPYRISRIEVWISDDRSDYQQGSKIIAAISDLAEGDEDKYTNENANYPPGILDPVLIGLNGIPLADNRSNPLYGEVSRDNDIDDIDKAASLLKSRYNMVQTRDFEVFRGRKLNPSEFTFHPQLGTISLNIRLRPNQVLGVSYQYYYNANCEEVYQVGDMSSEGEGNTVVAQQQEPVSPNLTFVKMLKSSNQRVSLSTWDLMMKNVYSLNTRQLSPEDFQFDVFFEDDSDATLKKYIPIGDLRYRPLLQVFNLDTLNTQLDPQPDGVFDYVPGVTVIPNTGSIVFPVLEPFGSSLAGLLGDPALADSLAYQALYDTSLVGAREQINNNKFRLIGKVKSDFSGEINLGPFVPQGSVRVTAGGRTLVENVDYQIDYSLGRLRIINPAYLQQGTPVNVSFEDNALFSLQQKTMLGLRAEYEFSDKLNVGATYLRLFERPFTQKVNLGDDPINNRIFGLDLNYSTESTFLTKAVDKLPFLSTKEPSFLNFSAEVAALKPGHNGAINLSDDETGVVNIDDFEGTVSGILLGSTRTNDWVLASTPSTLAESEVDNLNYGANRALLNWYVIDNNARRGDDNSYSYTRLVQQDELFNRNVEVAFSNLFTFDLSYYPTERGPYNFDVPGGTPYSAGVKLSSDGTELELENPESRWGGIMRTFTNTDFEAANYESIEFWMLNPFMERRDGEQHVPAENGKIVFHLGSVSEDVLKDGKQFYENSIPTDPDRVNTLVPSIWGQVSNVVPVVDAFDITNGADQDVGFDGLNDEQELAHYESWLNIIGASFPIPNKVLQDPSNDNYIYFNDGDAYGDDDPLLQRMRQFNGPEGNAPLSNGDNQTLERRRGNPRPDKEDLNNNRSLDQAENYYEYEFDIINDQGEVDITGSPYIREVRTTTNTSTNQEEVWYRVRIPIREGRSINGIEGFRGIQFMRMFVTGFSSAKTFRLAEFQLRRNQWRQLANECVSDIDPGFEFTLDDVGIEENSTKRPFNYVTPRGIKQERIFSTFSNLLQDEKSMSFNFCGMGQDCQGSVYKISNLDLTYYERLQMFVHAEKVDEDPNLDDNEIALFVKLGKDFDRNYYEYEIPLVLSDENLGRADQSNIWLDTNYVDINLDVLKDLKLLRKENNGPITEIFDMEDPEKPRARRKIKGNPSLGYIKVIQIGVRNIDKDSPSTGHCAEVWVNELRASGLEQRGGYAGIARMQMKLADLGEVNMSGSYTSVGWGAIDQSIQEREREETVQYDLSTNLELGKFFPKESGVSIPFYGQYSKVSKTPIYDPFERDLTIDEAKQLADTPEEAQEIEDRAKETTTIKAFNFTDVKKTSTGSGSPKPWSIENFSVSYAFSETVNTDPILRENKIVETSTGLDYNYNTKAKYWQPLKGIKANALKLLSELNISLLPSSFSFSTTVDRYKGTRTFRLPDTPVFTFDDQRFRWDRQYRLKWDFTKSIQFDYTANARSTIDELRQTGIADDPDDRRWVNESGEDYTQRVNEDPGTVTDYWWDNFQNLGRGKSYDHQIGLTYNLPIKYLPGMDWVTVKADYNADYSWQAEPLIKIDDVNGPGNIIQNSQRRSLTGTFNFDRFYSKWGYLKKIQDGNTTSTRSRRRSRRTRGNTQNDQNQEEEGEERKVTAIERILIRPLLSLRTLRVTYREDLSSMIPGFEPNAKLLGLSSGFEAPGLGFIAGLQPDLNVSNENNWLFENADNGWFNPSYAFNEQLSQSRSHNLDINVDLEIFDDFTIDLDFNKRYDRRHTEVFKNKNATGDVDFMQLAAYDVGSFQETYISFNTLFGRSPSTVYGTFKANREIISNRLPNEAGVGEHPSDPGYAFGYGERSYDVIVPAFISAYEGDDPNTIGLDLENKMSDRFRIPAPNWTLRYDGLKNLPWFKDILSSFSLTHSYKSTLAVNQFNSIPNYDSLDPFAEVDNGDNYYTRLEIPAMSIVEQFAPLLGISFKTKNDMNFDLQYKQGRTLNLALQTDLKESRNKEIVLGFGYTIENFSGFFGGGNNNRRSRRNQEESTQQDQNDSNRNRRGRVTNTRGRTLKINVDFSFRDDVTYVYNFLSTEDIPEPQRGVKEISINPNVEYDMNENLTMRFFVNYRRSEPKNTISFPTTNVLGGVTMRFKLN